MLRATDLHTNTKASKPTSQQASKQSNQAKRPSKATKRSNQAKQPTNQSINQAKQPTNQPTKKAPKQASNTQKSCRSGKNVAKDPQTMEPTRNKRYSNSSSAAVERNATEGRNELETSSDPDEAKINAPYTDLTLPRSSHARHAQSAPTTPYSPLTGNANINFRTQDPSFLPPSPQFSRQDTCEKTIAILGVRSWLQKAGNTKTSKEVLCNAMLICEERPNVRDVSIRSRNRPPSRKGMLGQ